jgi:hypothetical protein
MAEVASSRAKARYAAAIAFMCCAFVGACTGVTESRPEVATTPVYRITGVSAARPDMRQEVPKAHTIRMGEDDFRQP